MWSVTKTCPINSEYDGYWYFYEDIGKPLEKGSVLRLAGLAAGWGRPESQPEQGSLHAVRELRPIEEHRFSEVYDDMKGHVEQAYMLALGLQDFSWYPLDILGGTYGANYSGDGLMVMPEMLPSAEAVKPLLRQCDRCNALAVKVWLESPHREPSIAVQQTRNLTIGRWRVLCCQLTLECSKAQLQVEKLKAHTDRLFADIEHSLSISTSPAKEIYLAAFSERRAEYDGLLCRMVVNLEQARRSASELTCQGFNPLVTTQE